MKLYSVLLPTSLGAVLLFGASPALAQGPSLGAAERFAVLGATTVTSTGLTTISGDLGVSPGTSVTGFPPGTLTGTIRADDAVARQAQTDLTTAYNALAGAACTTNMTNMDLGGRTLTPGVYCFASSAAMNGVLTLDAQGNSNAVFIFQIGSTLLVNINSSVLTIKCAQDANVFWQVGSSATLAAGVVLRGNIVALASITLGQGTTVFGRALARTGAVTMDISSVQVVGVAAATAINYGGGSARLNPSGSLILTGTPVLGQMVKLGVHNPLATQKAGGPTLLALALTKADPGPQIPGWGMRRGNGVGELLIDSPILVFGLTPWDGITPSELSVQIPNDCAIVGARAYLQGIIGDLGLTTAGLTEGAELTVGIK